ncbi:group II intron reverse transcriptase/maturase, partial [Listeria cornellensis]
MHSMQKTEKSGYHQKDRLEAESYDEAHSILSGEISRQDGVENLIDKLTHRDNLNLAYQKVVRNKGAAGIDGVTVEELLPYLREHRESLLEQLRTGKYQPKPVKRVTIPKPDGGKRQLGIPCVVDRLVQQAIAQILEPIFDPHFSDNSYGFRPNRSAHQAILKAKSFYEAGYKYVVDIDMKQYFDTVHHDKLMGFLEKRIQDKLILCLIRRFLQSGVMIGTEKQETKRGTPQGGNLSPLLSNIYLHAFDEELHQRGHLFVRYADDCNIYVRSKRAGERVMA